MRKLICESSEEGKGTAGCLLSLVMLIVAVFLMVKIGPAYYANFNLSTAMEREVSAAAARSLSPDVIIKSLINTAAKNDVELTKENIKITRKVGQLVIEVNYNVPVDLVIYKHTLHFYIEKTGFSAS